MTDHPIENFFKRCQNCGTPDEERPTIFRGEPFCSVKCAKALGLKD